MLTISKKKKKKASDNNNFKHKVRQAATQESGFYHGSPILSRNGFHVWIQTKVAQFDGASVPGEPKSEGGPESSEELGVGLGKDLIPGGNIWTQRSKCHSPQLGVSL